MASVKTKGKQASALERFWGAVEKTDSCWLFTRTGSHGYGRIHFRGNLIRAHRFSWQLHFGEIPAGLCVCHRCDVPNCVNPDHLFLGTVAINNADKMGKGRNKAGVGERNGNATLTAEQVLEIRALRSQGLTNKAIALRFGVVTSVVSGICTGTGWKHVSQ